jgi:sulfide dehydrogenase cytochrome subunit
LRYPRRCSIPNPREIPMKARAKVLFAGLAAVASIASAQQPAPPPPSFAAANVGDKGVRSMAATCAACHGPGGRAASGSSVPGLAGRPAASTIEAMKAFKDGKREATVMHQIAKGYGDAEIAALALYFAAQSQ